MECGTTVSIQSTRGSFSHMCSLTDEHDGEHVCFCGYWWDPVASPNRK